MDKSTPFTHPPEGYRPQNETESEKLRGQVASYRRDLERERERIATLEQMLQEAKRTDRVLNALQEVADCKLFETYDPTDCTEEVYETVWALIQDARAALQEWKV